VKCIGFGSMGYKKPKLAWSGIILMKGQLKALDTGQGIV
jgi:hypothetical protein